MIVCDAGGTSFDVSLVRDGAISYSRDTWLGPQFTGHLTGSTAVDVRSIGAGGGSIAWVDSGGLLRVGPHSAGADPGPASYGRGGSQPTVTDAAVVVGYIDPQAFLGGRMTLDGDGARDALGPLAEALGRSVEDVARAVLAVANEHMIGAIKEITVNEGIDPRESAVIAGGGASGLNIADIATELGCRQVLLPATAGVLSATGAHLSDVVMEFGRGFYATTESFDINGVNHVLDLLDAECAPHLDAGGRTNRVFVVSARYVSQVWELEVSLPGDRIDGETGVQALRSAFDAVHRRVLGVEDLSSPVECLGWIARLTTPRAEHPLGSGAAGEKATAPTRTRDVYFADGWLPTVIASPRSFPSGTSIDGPAVVEETTTTIVVPPGARVTRSSCLNYRLELPHA